MNSVIALVLVSAVLGLGALSTDGHAAPTAAASPVWADMQHCDMGNEVVALVAWETANAGEQWLDISLFNNGFAPGTHLGIGPLETDRGARFLFGLLPNRTHYVRVNTRTAAGWESSPWSSFQTIDCERPGPPRLVDGRTRGCEQGQLLAVFSWVPSAAGQEQWLDLSTQNNGFAPGTFISAGPLDASFAIYRWRGLRPYTTHYWRINTWTGSQWLTSATGSFRTGVILGAAADNLCPEVVSD